MDEAMKLELRAITERYKPEQIIAALKKWNGWMHLAAQELGCDAQTISRYIKLYPDVMQAYEDATDKMTDIAEQSLFNLISKENVAATIFYLKTRGRHRGWTEKVTFEIVPFGLQQKLVDLCNAKGIKIDELLAGVIAEVEASPEESITVTPEEEE